MKNKLKKIYGRFTVEIFDDDGAVFFKRKTESFSTHSHL